MINNEQIEKLIAMAHKSITKHRREYAPSFYEIQQWIDNHNQETK